MFKFSKLTLWTVSSVNDTLRHILLRKSLSTEDFWERETPRLVPRDTNLVLQICLRDHVCLAHTTYFNWSLWTSHRNLLASLSSNFLLGDIKRGSGNSSLNNWFIVRLGRTNHLKQHDASFWYASEFNSKNVANKLLHGGFIILFMKFIIIYDRFVCQHRRHHYIFKDTLRKETKICWFLKLHSLICVNVNYTANYSTSAIRMQRRELQSISRLTTHAD